MRTTRRIRRAAVALGAAVAVTAAMTACGSDSPGDINLRLDFVHTGKDAIWTYGMEQGFFEDAGLTVSLDDGKGSATTAQTVGNGSDTFGLVDSGTLITVAAQGVPVKAVASVFDKSPVTILSPADKAVQTPQDLVGKKVAITSGDGPSTLLPALLDANGLTEDQMTLVNLQPQAKLTSLLSGNVDVVSTISLVQAALEQQGMKVHSMPYRDFGVETPGYYLVTSAQYLQKNKEQTAKFVEATQKSIDATLANPQAAIDSFMNKYPEYDRAQAEAELNLMLPLIKGPQAQGHPTGWMSEELAESTGTLLEKYGALENPKPVGDYLTNEFIK